MSADVPPPSESPARIALSLISHTNVGKTALARTLLGRDVGEVRDAPHVTAAAEQYTMIESAAGDVLSLWDTPGFGDSARLARRLAVLDQPILGFLSMVWDRWRDRALWSSQQAVRNVRDEADVVLYLVNASESPQDAGYIDAEMQILEWIGKPVIVLLNQTGPPRGTDTESREMDVWRTALGSRTPVRSVLSLDAFARCWVQEDALLREVDKVLPPDKHRAFGRVSATWRDARERQFAESMRAIAIPLAHASCDRAVVPNAGVRGSLAEMGRAIGLATQRVDPAKKSAMRILSERLDAEIRGSTDRLIALHHLDGRAAAEVTARLADSVTTDSPVDERKAAVIGGFLSGALTGLAADLAAGGLTFGAGFLAGGVVGALGAAGLARGFNLVRGKNESAVRWSDEFVAALPAAAVLRYLAIAHYGRGRGEWAASEYPPFWRDAVGAAIERVGGVADVVALRAASPCEIDALTAAWQAKLGAITRSVLGSLYPDAAIALV